MDWCYCDSWGRKILLFFDRWKTAGGSKITEANYEISLVGNLLWPVVINKTIMQQNRIDTLHHNGNPLE